MVSKGSLDQNTLGAFSDLSFLTFSPCCATRSYRPEAVEEEAAVEEEVKVEEEVAEGPAEGTEVGGTIPGL